MKAIIKSNLKLKKFFYISLIVTLLIVLQNSNLFNFPGNIKPFLLFPFIVAFSMFTNKKSIAILSIIGGFVFDCYSDRIFGFSSLFLLLTCIFNSLMCKQIIKIHLFNFIILTTIELLIFEVINFAIELINLNFQNIWPIWLNHIFPTIALTILISPIFYLLNYKLHKNKLNVLNLNSMKQ